VKVGTRAPKAFRDYVGSRELRAAPEPLERMGPLDSLENLVLRENPASRDNLVCLERRVTLWWPPLASRALRVNEDTRAARVTQVQSVQQGTLAKRDRLVCPELEVLREMPDSREYREYPE